MRYLISITFLRFEQLRDPNVTPLSRVPPHSCVPPPPLLERDGLAQHARSMIGYPVRMKFT